MHAPRFSRRVAAVAAVLLGLAGWFAAPAATDQAAAAEETPSSYGAPAKVDTPILRLPLMKAAPTIDGVMEKGEWDDSSALSAFFYDYAQADFRFMAAPQTQVEVYGGYDRDHLYMAFTSPVFPVNSWFKARGRFPDVLNHPLYGILWDDKLELELRPHNDLAEGFRLGLFRWDVNPINTFADWYWSQQTGPDFKWKSNATIRSQLNYQTKVGPASINLGGGRVQYPGRTQVDMEFPSLNVTTGTLEAGPVAWTPSLRLGVSTQQRIDQGIQFPFVYNPRAGGGVDSARFNAGRRSTQLSFETPIKIFDFQWSNSISLTEQLRDFPEERLIVGVRDTSQRATRIFARTFETNVDWTTSFNLPRFFQGSWNVSPSVTVANVDPASGLFVRTERSGGRWVRQSKRLSYAVSASPTLYALLPGLGPVAALRHSVTPAVSFSYSPAASVSDEYLAALGRSRVGYLGALAQNRVSLNLATNLEAKLRTRAEADSGGGEGGGGEAGRKIKLLSLNFSPLTYDFVRADTTGNGFTDRTFAISARTDLLPGLDFRASYDLFQGDPMSDTATFSPYRTDVGVNFALNGKSGIFVLLGRLFGRRGELEAADSSGQVPSARQDVDRTMRQMNAAGGGAMRGMQMALPSGEGWNLSIQYNATRQRPPRGGTLILNDPVRLCEPQKAFGILAYDQCVFNAQSAPAAGLTSGQSAIGAPVFLQPPTQNITANTSFSLTPNWSAQWSTQYDVVRARFASQQVGLQRAMHDWNAVFSVSQTPNGNFAFNFFIALKAQPELKFNYDRQTLRGSSF